MEFSTIQLTGHHGTEAPRSTELGDLVVGCGDTDDAAAAAALREEGGTGPRPNQRSTPFRRASLSSGVPVADGHSARREGKVGNAAVVLSTPSARKRCYAEKRQNKQVLRLPSPTFARSGACVRACAFSCVCCSGVVPVTTSPTTAPRLRQRSPASLTCVGDYERFPQASLDPIIKLPPFTSAVCVERIRFAFRSGRSAT